MGGGRGRSIVAAPIDRLTDEKAVTIVSVGKGEEIILLPTFYSLSVSVNAKKESHLCKASVI